jgi:hypothetical protein
VQFAASIWRGGKTPTGANVHGAKQLKTDVDLGLGFRAAFCTKFIGRQQLLEEKFQVVAFNFSQNKIFSSLL